MASEWKNSSYLVNAFSLNMVNAIVYKQFCIHKHKHCSFCPRGYSIDTYVIIIIIMVSCYVRCITRGKNSRALFLSREKILRAHIHLSFVSSYYTVTAAHLASVSICTSICVIIILYSDCVVT